MKPSGESESSLAAALSDPGAGTRALATGRPLEEWSDWPVIGSRQSPDCRRAASRLLYECLAFPDNFAILCHQRPSFFRAGAHRVPRRGHDACQGRSSSPEARCLGVGWAREKPEDGAPSWVGARGGLGSRELSAVT